jgi:hypothetical protein
VIGGVEPPAAKVEADLRRDLLHECLLGLDGIAAFQERVVGPAAGADASFDEFHDAAAKPPQP